MAAKYTMQEMKNLRKEGETLLYPKMVMQDCCGTDELARMIAGETTFSTGEIRGIIGQLAQRMAREMAGGHAVKLEGIGTFTPSLTLKKGKERETPSSDLEPKAARSPFPSMRAT